MTWMTLLLAVGATVRLTRLFAFDLITFPIRDWVGARTEDTRSAPSWKGRFFAFVDDMITCPWCLSIWMGTAVAAAAWFYGQTAWFMVPALLLTASQAAGMALTKGK